MTTTTPDPIGHGILCPFQRDGKGDFANGSGVPLLSSDITQLLGIIGPSVTEPGEVPWRTELGTRLIGLKHRGIHQELTRSSAEHMTSGAIRRWEPRARPGPTSVRVEATKLYVTVRFVPLGYKAEEAQAVTVSPQM